MRINVPIHYIISIFLFANGIGGLRGVVGVGVERQCMHASPRHFECQHKCVYFTYDSRYNLSTQHTTPLTRVCHQPLVPMCESMTRAQ